MLLKTSAIYGLTLTNIMEVSGEKEGGREMPYQETLLLG